MKPEKPFDGGSKAFKLLFIKFNLKVPQSLRLRVVVKKQFPLEDLGRGLDQMEIRRKRHTPVLVMGRGVFSNHEHIEFTRGRVVE